MQKKKKRDLSDRVCLAFTIRGGTFIARGPPMWSPFVLAKRNHLTSSPFLFEVLNEMHF